ncbi:MAG TPA: discoidin domain-containing protein [Polyangiaceae bacterium]|nr:discoidin domain-containing protein [Polyangiaceae bacterium]
MNSDGSRGDPDFAPPSVAVPASRLAASWEWLWRAGAMREARRALAVEEEASHLGQRAAIAVEVGEHILSPATSWAAGEANHLAAAMFAESIAWSLRRAGAAGEPHGGPDQPELARLVESQRAALLTASGTLEGFEKVRRQLLERDFEREASPRALANSARELGLVARRLLDQAGAKRQTVDTLWLQRTLRLALAVLPVVALVYVASVAPRALEARADLAVGKAWKTSSSHGPDCVSPQQSCGQRYFFHTHQNDGPWVEIDLARNERISKVRVLNRTDCCWERAAPLVIEVSTDRQNWKQVGKNTAAFRDWRATFEPTSARYVRLRVARRSVLHLDAVRVFR